MRCCAQGEPPVRHEYRPLRQTARLERRPTQDVPRPAHNVRMLGYFFVTFVYHVMTFHYLMGQKDRHSFIFRLSIESYGN